MVQLDTNPIASQVHTLIAPKVHKPNCPLQVHNALGFAYFSMEKSSMAIDNYKKAVEMQPGYVTAWNNLGDAFEKGRDWKNAYNAYSEALSYAPDNKIARERADSLRSKAEAAR
jgi:tetratricopeptide (TPR) repeat protein